MLFSIPVPIKYSERDNFQGVEETIVKEWKKAGKTGLLNGTIIRFIQPEDASEMFFSGI